MLQKLNAGLQRELWGVDIDTRSRLQRIGVRIGQAIFLIAGKFADGQLTLRAMSLVYTTLLSLVPMLAVSFSVLKAFGARNQIEPLLHELLEPLGAAGNDVYEHLIGFVDNLQVGVLGSVGIALLFYTTSSLIYKIELALNSVWNVVNARPLARRFSDYFSAVLIGPVMVLALFGLIGKFLTSPIGQTLGPLLQSFADLGPYLLVCGVFACLYGFIPNTRVSLRAALVGGLFAGVLWYASGKLFAQFVVTSSSYSAIYSGFAGAVLFMLWLYIGWLIILVGGQVAAYVQNPHFLDGRREDSVLDSRRREELALDMLTVAAQAHFEQRPPPTLGDLEMRHHDVPAEDMKVLLQWLLEKDLLVATAAEPPGLIPACAPETLTLHDFFAALRGPRGVDTSVAAVDSLLAEIDAAVEQVLDKRTVRDLILAEQQHRADASTVVSYTKQG